MTAGWREELYMNLLLNRIEAAKGLRSFNGNQRRTSHRVGIATGLAVVLCALCALSCDPNMGGVFTPAPGSDAAIQAEAHQIVKEIEDDAELENLDLRRAVDSDSFAPEGTLYGFILDQSLNCLYVLGEQLPDGSVNITGAVLEDITGNLILMEEITPDGAVKVTVPSGDSAEFAETADGISVTYNLTATSPPSTVVVFIDPNGNATVDEAASVIFEPENPDYNAEPLELPRAQSLFRVLAAKDHDGLLAQPMFDCPVVNKIGDTVSFSCAAFGVLTRKIPKSGIEAGCMAVSDFIDGFAGSPVLPGTPSGPTPFPRVVAGTKLGSGVLCALATKGWDVGQLLTRANAAGLVCLGTSIVSSGTVLITGQSTSDVICELIGGDPISWPEEDPFFATGCENTCEFAFDGQCDDGGPDANTSLCEFGTDCSDCGARDVFDDEGGPDCFDDGMCNGECPIDPPDPDCTNTDFCENFEICCDSDGICDLVRCPGPGIDSDCTNFDICDRLDVCCDDDDRCDDPAIPCPESDRDCNNCAADGFCIEECVPEDPDCSGDTDCPTDNFCDPNCPGEDPDCTSGEFGDFFYANLDGSTGTDPAQADIAVFGVSSAPTFTWDFSGGVLQIYVAEVNEMGLWGIFAVPPDEPEDAEVVPLSPPIRYGDFSIPDTKVAPGFESAPPLEVGQSITITVVTPAGQIASLVFRVE